MALSMAGASTLPSYSCFPFQLTYRLPRQLATLHLVSSDNNHQLTLFTLDSSGIIARLRIKNQGLDSTPVRVPMRIATYLNPEYTLSLFSPFPHSIALPHPQTAHTLPCTTMLHQLTAQSVN